MAALGAKRTFARKLKSALCQERKSAVLIVITFSASAKQALRESGGNHVSRSFV
jgi:hypothetical protein